MTFDDDLRKELQQRLDPIASPAEWEPVRARMTAARARRDRTRATIAATVAASLALGGITLAWNDRKDPVGAASHPSAVSTPSPDPTTPPEDAGDIDAPAETSAALPPGRSCPDGWRFFVNPVLHFDICYPDDWGFPAGRDLPNRELISGEDLYGGLTLESPDFPYDGPDPGPPHNPYVIHLTFNPGAPRTAPGECDYEETLEVVGATARWCEANADPGFDSVTFSDDAPVRFMKMAIPFGVQPQPASARKADPNDQLNVLGEARRELWDEHRDTIFTILRSIRPHQPPLPDELSLPLTLLSADGATLTLEARPSACGGMDRFEVNETPTEVAIRAVGKTPVTIGADGHHIPCPPPMPERFTVTLKEPLGDRRLAFGLVSAYFGVAEQLHCSGEAAYDEPRSKAESFGSRYAALRDWLNIRVPEVRAWDLVEYPGGYPDNADPRGYLYRAEGRTLGAFTVIRDTSPEGWAIGESAYCLVESHGDAYTPSD